MKWVQHLTTANTDLKLIRVINKFGLEGYGLYWLCVEIAGNSGETAKIKEDMGWKDALISMSKLEPSKLSSMLKFFGDIDLIDSTHLEKGDLYMPKLLRYGDDYTKRVRRVSEQETCEFATVVFKHFYDSYKLKFGVVPAVSGAREMSLLKKRKTLFESEEEAKRLVEEFLESKKAEECGYTISVCFSTHTINAFFSNTLVDNREDSLFEKYATKKK
jgi:hypothetical protein